MSCVGCCHILIHKLLCPARTCVESESIPYRYMLFRPRTFEPRLAYTPHGFSQRNSRGRRSALGGGGGPPGGAAALRGPAGEQLLRHFLEYTLYSQSNLNLLYIPTFAPPIPHPVRAAQRRRGRSSSLGVIRLVCMLAPWHTTPLLPLPRSPPPHRVGSPPQLGRGSCLTAQRLFGCRAARQAFLSPSLLASV
jgi:hypothetical protein